MALERPRVALDANILLDLANREETVLDAIATLRRRLRHPNLLVTPTVVHELGHLIDCGSTPEIRTAAHTAARRLYSVWKFDLAQLSPVTLGIAERIADHVRASGLLPTEEHNDSLILAEAALLECTSARFC